MISSLRIQNLALVEDLTLDLKGGFTVLTGETGAGKSLLVDALSLLIGARSDGELVRLGSERATVEGVIEGSFDVWTRFLDERGLPCEQPVVIRREVGTNNRSRAWINGAACALADLKEAGRIWMRLASQHDHQNLLAEERHLALLDEVLGLQPDLTAEVEALRGADARLKARRKSASEREQRLEWLAEQIGDLDKLCPKPGEWATLRAEREPLRHAAALEAAFRESAENLREAQTPAQTAHRALARAASILPDAQGDVDRLRSLVLELEDLLALTQDQAIRWSKEGVERIEQLEARLAQFEKLARRHRCEPEELPARLQALKDEQKSLLAGETALEELEAQLRIAAEAYRQAAAKLHARRESLIPPLEKEVHRRLAKLGMAGARIQVRLSIAEEASSPVLHNGLAARVALSGFSALAIWIESNAGEGFRPLAKIASGGEMSRLMLSLMLAGLALAKDGAEAHTLVLDEVDAGIGGETAIAVGEAVQELGRRHQVLAVTHLAQVAARSNHHGRLSKATSEGRTRSDLAWLADEDRVRELARLLSGHPDRLEAQQHARSLLA
ncbi:MAG TPA: DNA repair protein RecN [Holophaga sp.]|jgi:DNA repair protein RecN (Recombination protein N)|nr:DNA repair protein RecN [Holophaga sp.]